METICLLGVAAILTAVTKDRSKLGIAVANTVSDKGHHLWGPSSSGTVQNGKPLKAVISGLLLFDR